MEIPSHRACAHCRSQKVRCIPEDGNPDLCQRCARSGRPCVFTPLQKRKQRKRTDTRVAELEREMRAMRSMLKKKQEDVGASQISSVNNEERDEHGPKPTGAVHGLWYKDRSWDANLEHNSMPRYLNAKGVVEAPLGADPALTRPEAEKLWPERLPDRPFNDESDVIDRGILSMATARQLVETYRTVLYPNYPMVYLEDSTTADVLRSSKPTLFLAIIAAAAMKEEPALSTVLDREVLQAYAQRSLVNSEKSIELVQALLISCFWYHPPNKFGQLKYYEYIHMAATMALDIHIGERPSSRRQRFDSKSVVATSSQHPAEDVRNPDLSMSVRGPTGEAQTATIEARRTFLSCYVVCGGVSISLRRPRLLHATSYVRECIEYLERSPQAVPLDRQIIAWCRLMVISEEISIGFSYDDPGNVASIYDLRTQMMLRDFDRKLSDWERSIPEVDFSENLRMIYYTTRLYLYEIALHIDHDPEDFKAPYQMGSITSHPHPDDELPTQPLVEAIADCITSAHRLIDSFIKLDLEMARGLPVYTYIRVSLAAFVLAKLCLSAAHPDSRIAKILDRSALKADVYMDRCILHVRDVVGPKKCRVPAIFLALLFKLRQWCTNPELIDRTEDDEAKAGATIVMNEASRLRATDPALGTAGVGITEHGSSVDESASYRSLDESPSPSVSKTSESNTSPIERQSIRFDGQSLGGTVDGGAGVSQPMGAFGTGNAPTVANMGGGMPPYMPMDDSIMMDASFMEILNDPNIFPDGGLTGLDDWNSLSVSDDMRNIFATIPTGTTWPGNLGVMRGGGGAG